MSRPMRIAVIVVVIALLHAPNLSAHEMHDAVTSGPSSWDIGVMVLLACAAAMYVLGTRQLQRRGARVRTVERAAFWIGWAAMFAAVAPPMDAAAATAFSSSSKLPDRCPCRWRT